MQIVTLKPSEPITAPVTKFGGQPVWLGEPQWPVSTKDGEVMRFICQIRLPGSPDIAPRLAYVFMSDEPEETWDAEAGANAVIIQPGPFDPHVSTLPQREGPSLEKMVPGVTGNRLEPASVEYRAELTELPDDVPADDETTFGIRIGGPPTWLQNEEYPANGPWTFVALIDSGTDAYSINFGDCGVGYVFVSLDGRRARFLWQCC
jgi:uncharacterized protein YwqG